MQTSPRNWLARRARGIVPAAALSLALAFPAAGQTELNVAIHADLKNIDPIWTTALITSNHGYAVYDTLFATDADFNVQPQMAEGYTVSDDGLVYTITLTGRGSGYLGFCVDAVAGESDTTNNCSGSTREGA